MNNAALPDPGKTDVPPGSGLDIFLIASCLIFFGFLINGYHCFRIDHQTQLPLLFMQLDDSLYPRDWFLQNYGAFRLRYPHLQAIHLASKLFGLAGGILVLYLACSYAAFIAWMKIARHSFGSVLPGVIVCVMAILYRGELGSNHLVEHILIPRQEALAIASWALYLLMLGKHFPSGLLFGLAYLFHPAIGIQFILVLIVCALIRREEGWLPGLGLFALGFLPFVVPWSLHLSETIGVLGELSDKEIIRLSAWIRHPHHMLPTTWAIKALGFLGLLTGLLIASRSVSHEDRSRKFFSTLVAVIVVFLLVCAFFIVVVPIKSLVLFQPFRVSILLYLSLYLMIAPHVFGLLKSADRLKVFRAVSILSAFQFKGVMFAAFAVEWLLASDERAREGGARSGGGRAAGMLALIAFVTSGIASLGSPEALLLPAALLAIHGVRSAPAAPQALRRYAPLLFPVACLALVIIENDTRPLLLIGFGLILGLRTLRGRFARPLHALRLAGVAVAITGYAAVASFFIMPVAEWVESEDPVRSKWAAKLMWEYQFVAHPIHELERVGLWARENTPVDALFLTPPSKQQADFRLWSRRSIVFAAKCFPYRVDGIIGWRERYFAFRGIEDSESPEFAELKEAAMDDIGMRELSSRYKSLSADQIVALARRYEADYVVSATKYGDQRLRPVFQGHDQRKSEWGSNEMYVYELL